MMATSQAAWAEYDMINKVEPYRQCVYDALWELGCQYLDIPMGVIIKGWLNGNSPRALASLHMHRMEVPGLTTKEYCVATDNTLISREIVMASGHKPRRGSAARWAQGPHQEEV
jgi:hypothetical protein